MNIKAWLITGCTAAMALSIFCGCELDSTDSIIRNVGVIISGLYLRDDGASPVVQNTANGDIMQFNISQDGDQLQVVDNYGIKYSGSIGSVSGSEGTRVATYQVNGTAKDGQAVTINGKFEVAGTESVMTGDWVEPNHVLPVYATATVPQVPEDEVSTNETEEVEDETTTELDPVEINPQLAEIEVEGSVNLSATGGNGFYTWLPQGDTVLGRFSSISGSGGKNATWKASTNTGSIVISAASAGDTNFATIIIR